MTKNSEKSIVTSFQLRTKKFSFLIRYLLLVTCYSLLVTVFLVSCSPQKERTYRKTKIMMDRERSTAYLKDKGMLIDLGGIAKGYASDKAVVELKKNGITSGLV